MYLEPNMGIQQLPLPVHSQWWSSPKTPMLELGWEFYKIQTKELNIFPVLLLSIQLLSAQPHIIPSVLTAF